jgi:ribulose-5-phosphate 4-epimerase/fuculose-1-phosphate aldolase
MRDEGVIKFECKWTRAPVPDGHDWSELVAYRNRLYAEGLIGVYPDGIGFGNISTRWTCNNPAEHEQPTSDHATSPQFIISSSQTGQIGIATTEHFTLVTEYDIAANIIYCVGPMKASSESLTHAMIYATFPAVRAVVHVHSNADWKNLLNKIATSGADVSYGTPEMAAEVQRLAREEDLANNRIFVMAGHEDGILSFGASLPEAYRVIKQHLCRSSFT